MEHEERKPREVSNMEHKIESLAQEAPLSVLWKYAGLSVDPETGRAPKRTAGSKLGFNPQLRMTLFRLGRSLLRAESKSEPDLGRNPHEGSEPSEPRKP